MVKKYIPNGGDVVWIDFDPIKGHEQAKLRPALVLSPDIYNRKTGMAVMCPITSQVKTYPFEVLLKNKKIDGVVLVDQIRSLDWKARGVKYCTKVSKEVMNEVQEKLAALIFS